MELSHNNLCNIAVRWLKRPSSGGGHGCHIAVSEVRSGWNGEVPDAIGFRAAGGQDDGSIVVEVKVSRADFLADAKKAHRNGETLGLGNWRYYMCPEGLIKPEDLPEKFGLLYVNKRGHVKHIVSPFTGERYYKEVAEWITENRFESNQKREQFILVKLFARVGDAEQLNSKLKGAYAEVTRLQKSVNDLRKRNTELSHRAWRKQFNQEESRVTAKADVTRR
ncbi:hypothetical protein KQ246_07200 [Pseudoalteromonas shioyasakiensis]|nr:hypothetical protein KQ246_07200 [Pseudoalteromonas shioyasakiensis]